MGRTHWILAVVILMCTAAVSSRPSGAAETYARPFASAAVTYDDNLRLVVDPPEDITGVVVNAAADIGRRTPTSDIYFRPRGRFTRYDSQFDLDSNNLYLDFSGDWQRRRSGFGVDANFTDDTTLTSEQQTTGNVQFNVPRQRWNINPYYSYFLTQRDTLKISAAYQDVQYGAAPEEAVAEDPFTDFTTRNLNLIYTRSLGPRLSVSGTLAASVFDTEERPVQFAPGLSGTIQNKTTSYIAQGGVEYEFSTQTSGSFNFGLRQTEFEVTTEDPVRGRLTSNAEEDGQVYGVSLRHEGYTSTLRGSLSRSLIPTSSGRVLDQIALVVAGDRDFNSRFGGALNIALRRNEEPLQVAGTQNRDLITASGRLRYRIRRDLFIVGSYRYRWRKLEQANNAAESNTIFVTLTWRGVRQKFMD